MKCGRNKSVRFKLTMNDILYDGINVICKLSASTTMNMHSNLRWAILYCHLTHTLMHAGTRTLTHTCVQWVGGMLGLQHMNKCASLSPSPSVFITLYGQVHPFSLPSVSTPSLMGECFSIVYVFPFLPPFTASSFSPSSLVGVQARPTSLWLQFYWLSRPLMDLPFAEPLPLNLVVRPSPSTSVSPERPRSNTSKWGMNFWKHRNSILCIWVISQTNH